MIEFTFISAIITEKLNPCQPSPCGPNSQCKEVNEQAVCSCLPTYFGSPPNCRPECVVSSECNFDRVCSNHKCIDPCPGPCGLNSKCQVINHSPICTCSPGQTGDPFIRCYPLPRKPIVFFVVIRNNILNIICLTNSSSCYTNKRRISESLYSVTLWSKL